MNWLKRLKTFLGVFWTTIFEETDFVLGVEYLFSLYGRILENIHQNWRKGLIAQAIDAQQDTLPFVVYIDVDTVEKAVTSISSILNGGEIGKEDSTAGWVADCKDSIPFPDMLEAHILNSDHTWFYGLDYKYQDKQFYFYADPSTFKWPKVKQTDENGDLHVYYRLFGRTKRTTVHNDAVAGFISPDLAYYAPVVWDIHQNGATVYNTKKLLAEVTGSVICEKDGAVNDVWDEQNYHCMLVGDKIYSSIDTANFEKGDTVSKGTVLFGKMTFHNSTDIPDSTDVAGIKVRTDVGELTAANTSKSAYIVSGTSKSGVQITNLNVLPLDGDTTVIANYKQKCIDNSYAANPFCPNIAVPSTVNPYTFVMNQLRRGRGCVVQLVASNLAKLSAALHCLRKSSCTAGVINVFVRASAEPITISVASFFAEAGLSVVSTEATVKIKQQCAEAKIFL